MVDGRGEQGPENQVWKRLSDELKPKWNPWKYQEYENFEFNMRKALREVGMLKFYDAWIDKPTPTAAYFE